MWQQSARVRCISSSMRRSATRTMLPPASCERHMCSAAALHSRALLTLASAALEGATGSEGGGIDAARSAGGTDGARSAGGTDGASGAGGNDGAARGAGGIDAVRRADGTDCGERVAGGNEGAARRAGGNDADA